MLKLEKDPLTQKLTLSFQHRDRLFDRPLLIAFCFALAFHFLSLLIFTIAPLKFNFPDYLLPPVSVEAEQLLPLNNEHDTVSSVELEQRKLVRRSYIEPVKRVMSLPRSPIQPMDDSIDFMENKDLSEYFGLNAQLYFNNEFSVPFEVAEITVELFGPLASSILANDSTNARNSYFVTTSNTLREYRIAFDILMDRRAGTIIWFSAIKNALSDKIMKKAELLLKNIRFLREKRTGITNGIIEITIRENSPPLEEANG